MSYELQDEPKSRATPMPIDATLVSIVVPAYNISNYLTSCVRSLASQSYEAVEILLVDDGSTDGTSEICDTLAGEYPQVKVIHKSNGGLSSARNTGLACAGGEYIMFVDGDDVISPDCVETLIAPMLDDPSVRMAVGEFKQITDMDARNEDWFSEAHSCEVMTDAAALGLMLYGGRFEISAACKLAKKDVWGEAPFPEGRFYEDLYCIARIVSKSPMIGMVSSPLYGYVMRSGSITGQKSASKKKISDYIDSVAQCGIDIQERFAEDAELNAAYAARLELEYCRIYRLLEEGEDEAYKRDMLPIILEKVRDGLGDYMQDPHVSRIWKLRAWILSRIPALYLPSFKLAAAIKGKKYE